MSPSCRTVCIRPSCTSLSASLILVLCRGTRCADAPSFKRPLPLYPRGPRSGPGYSCPGPSSLNSAPSAPLTGTARLHRIAAYTRCLRCARYRRLGDPRVDPCFRWPFFLDMSPSGTPGSSSVAYTQFLRRRHWPSTCSEGLGTSNTPHTPLHVGNPISGLTTVRFRYDLPSCSPSCRS